MKRIITLVFFAISIGFFLFYSFWLGDNVKRVGISDVWFEAEVVSSSDALGKGLGGRTELCPHCAMLFSYHRSGKYNFWMKDMKFDLDIIWINEDRIVYMAKNVSHNFAETIRPDVFSDKVLEINAGLSDEYGFREGDIVEIQ